MPALSMDTSHVSLGCFTLTGAHVITDNVIVSHPGDFADYSVSNHPNGLGKGRMCKTFAECKHTSRYEAPTAPCYVESAVHLIASLNHPPGRITNCTAAIWKEEFFLWDLLTSWKISRVSIESCGGQNLSQNTYHISFYTLYNNIKNQKTFKISKYCLGAAG